MRKIVANAINLLIMAVAVVSMSAESFYPKLVTFALAAPIALLSAIWLRNGIAPYEVKPSSKSFGRRDNRGLRTVALIMMAVFTYLAFVYFVAPFAAVASGQTQYRLGVVNDWDPYSNRAFTRRRSGRCARLHAYIQTGDGPLHMSRCIGKSYPVVYGSGSAIFVETVESPFGTIVTGRIR
jgi:cytochrome c biogenesis factor